MLARLRTLGVRLALDDFGTGYSSLSLLSRIPVHELKIDRSFVAVMESSVQAPAVIRSTLDLGRSLGLTVVAEGVESEPQRRTWAAGCAAGQGHSSAADAGGTFPGRAAARLRTATVDGGAALHEGAPVIRLPPRQSPKTANATIICQTGPREGRSRAARRTRVPGPAGPLRRRPRHRCGPLRLQHPLRRRHRCRLRAAPAPDLGAHRRARLPDRHRGRPRPACRPAARPGTTSHGRPGRAGLTLFAVAATTGLPLLWQSSRRAAGLPGHAQEEVRVVEHAGQRLLETGTPYLSRAEIAALPVADQLSGYMPYQPGMALFGLPRALAGTVWWSDARVAFAVAAGRPGTALAYLAGTLVAALAAVWCGLTVTRRLTAGASADRPARPG